MSESLAAPEDAFSHADIGAAASEDDFSESALKRVEFDPLGVFGPNHADINVIEPLGDGRVVARAFASARHSALFSGDGSTWSDVPLPAALDGLDSIDVAGDRWLVAGRDQSGSKPVTRAFFSDDQGTSWTELDFRASADPQTRLLVAAIASQERMVLAVKQDKLSLTELIVARGFAQDEEEILARSVEGTTLTFTVEGSSSPDSFELTGDEAAMLSDPIYSRLLLFYSDGGSPELVADFPRGLHAYGYGAADGFRLFVIFGFPAGILALADPDTPSDIAAGSGELTEFDKAGKWVGWSKDGAGWQWQTAADAFGLAGLADEGIEVSDVDLAVGDDYAIALVQLIQTMDAQTFETEPPPDSFEVRAPPEPARASTSIYEFPLPSRWYIAKAG